MNNFDFHLPTNIHFGAGAVSHLKEEVLRYGKRVFFVYSGAAKRTGRCAPVRISLSGTVCRANSSLPTMAT